MQVTVATSSNLLFWQLFFTPSIAPTKWPSLALYSWIFFVRWFDFLFLPFALNSQLFLLILVLYFPWLCLIKFWLLLLGCVVEFLFWVYIWDALTFCFIENLGFWDVNFSMIDEFWRILLLWAYVFFLKKKDWLEYMLFTAEIKKNWYISAWECFKLVRMWFLCEA